jgi:hypothetical protein
MTPFMHKRKDSKIFTNSISFALITGKKVSNEDRGWVI